TCCPSGEMATANTNSSDSCLASPPSIDILIANCFPLTREVYTKNLPSGEHAEFFSNLPLVSCVGLPPGTSIRKTSIPFVCALGISSNARPPPGQTDIPTMGRFDSKITLRSLPSADGRNAALKIRHQQTAVLKPAHVDVVLGVNRRCRARSLGSGRQHIQTDVGTSLDGHQLPAIFRHRERGVAVVVQGIGDAVEPSAANVDLTDLSLPSGGDITEIHKD